MSELTTADDDDRLNFLLIASDCPEARLAAYFTARRARRSDAGVVMLHVIEPNDGAHWATVAETMRAEAFEAAGALLADFARLVEAELGSPPQAVIREGRAVDEIAKFIAETPSVAILVLGASTAPEGPGPLVAALAGRPAYLGARPIPVTVVPGSIDIETLRSLS